MAFCCYNLQDYNRAAEFYETLTQLFPDNEEYQLYYVQSLVMGGSYADATRIAAASTQQPSQRLLLLKAQAEMESNLLSATSSTLSKCIEDDHETVIALAALEFRSKKYDEALQTFKIARQLIGDTPMLSYNITLCHYELGEYDKALSIVDDIVGNMEDDTEISKDSYLVEAINLKAAILHATNKDDAAKEILSTFDDNLDSVTIHNDVIVNSQTDPLIAMQKLDFLLSSEQFPPETLSNLLVLYMSHGQDNLAVDCMSTHKHIAKELLPTEVYNYFDALLMSTTSPLEASEMLQIQLAKYLPKLRVGKREVSSAHSTRPATQQHRPATSVAQRPTTALERKQHAHVETKQAELKTILEYYIPTLMLQAKIYFDQKDYSAAEQVLQKASDFCSDNDAYQTNLANIMFAEGKFEESIEHFELLLKNYTEADILKISPLALANLCVAYLMTDQNEKGEEVIKCIERQELLLCDTDEPTYHSCIINLVIGTLYCSRGNYVFGIERVCKSLEPCEKNLSLDTWVYARKCFLHLASVISKLMTHISSDTIQDIVCFLDDVERHGEHIVTTDIEDDDSLNPIMETSTIATEARQLKNLFIKVGA